MSNISIDLVEKTPTAEQDVEIVERKGLGHPDYICDAVSESISVALCREYVKHFGSVLHHNIDKGLLSAGAVELRFGGGKVLEPMTFYVGDRATFTAGRKKIPVVAIAKQAMRSWFEANLTGVDFTRHIRPEIVLKEGSTELTSIFKRKGKVLPANDTSAAVGYAPFTKTELTVLGLEMFLNSRAFKAAFPYTGEDVKVMAVRDGSAIDLTLAMPLRSNFVKNEKDYFLRKSHVLKAVNAYMELRAFRKFKVNFNTLDKKGCGRDGAYLTLLGTSAEDADSGQVGRGNRVNGVISFNRPMSTEAAAGKNPVSHVGKIYNVAANILAEEIYRSVPGAKETYVWMISEIGAPVDKPKKISINIVGSKKLRYIIGRGKVDAIVEGFLARMPQLIHDLTLGRYGVC